MPLLDVSDILDDPDFAADPGTLFLVSAAVRVNDFGEAESTPARAPLDGVAMPASGEMLKRLPEASRAEGAIVVYTRTRLSAQGARTEADQVEYLGALYTVSVLMDFTPYGAGFCGAVCTLTDLAAAQPG